MRNSGPLEKAQNRNRNRCYSNPYIRVRIKKVNFCRIDLFSTALLVLPQSFADWEIQRHDQNTAVRTPPGYHKALTYLMSERE